MKRVKLTRYHLWMFLVASLALAGLVWTHHTRTFADDHAAFDLTSASGRYVSAESAYDVSSVHALAAPNGSIAGGPVFFAGTAVAQFDGMGNVCGESDGFYGGFPPPGVNLGPNLFHGTYAVEAITGRITILTASDGAPSVANVFCGTNAAIDTTGKKTVFKTQVGYLQDTRGSAITTAEQINISDSSKGGCCATTGFLVHPRVWTGGHHGE